VKTLFSKAAPWLGGVGMAVGQAAVATRCTIPEQGACMGCGSCLVVIGSLATWAIHAKKQQQIETQENEQNEQQESQPKKQQQIEIQENVQNELQASQPQLPQPQVVHPQPQVVHSRD